MPFRKGVSGNPRGRPPRGTSVAEYVRAKAGGDGRRYIDLLDKLAMDEKQPSKIRVDAVRLLLARGFGNPVEEVHLETSNELMRASELRRTLKEAGLLDGPGEQQSSSSSQLRRWVDGDPDWNTAPSG